VEQRFFDDPNAAFVGFRYKYTPPAAESGFALEARPAYQGRHQCALRMTADLVLTQSCERAFPPWPSVDRTDWSSGAPRELER
jgi:hypothetical protein